ncbi:MAG: trigger factor [Lachnospiraceae bacterium]|nr:trigger factor [Lachnospiraceae bacterium]
MSVQVENLEKSMAKLTIEVSAEEFEAAMQKAYIKNKNRIQLQGFRKGKAPRVMIEKVYGAGIFYEDAANMIIPDAYEAAAKESGLEIVSQPEIDVVQIEKGKSFIFTAEVAVKPVVTLGEYKGLKYEAAAVEVTEEEVEAELKKVQEQQSSTVTVDDRAVEQGDIVTIDYEGFVDGVAFEGGKGADYDLTIGSHSFIDTFEDQLVGKNIGEDVEVNVTFPAEYHAEELAGKPALFKVAVKAIKTKVLPELDDEFASEVSDFETLEEYRADLKAKALERKEKEAKTAKENALVEKTVENATMEIADAMVVSQARNMVNDFAQRLQMQGMSIDQYMQYTGMTKDTMVEQMKPQALKRIQSRLVLEAVAEAENIQIDDEAVEAELQKMADAYKMELDKVKEYMGEAELDSIRKDLAVQKAVELIVDSAE